MRVLVVDDQATMRRIIVKLLQRIGIDECREAASAERALRILAVTAVDLIITDWNMPGMNGLEFVRTLRAQEATKTTPVLMVTTYGTKNEVMAAMEGGVTAYVVKPFAPEALLKRISGILYPPPGGR